MSEIASLYIDYTNMKLYLVKEGYNVKTLVAAATLSLKAKMNVQGARKKHQY